MKELLLFCFWMLIWRCAAIDSPPNQYALYGMNTTLKCSAPNALSIWFSEKNPSVNNSLTVFIRNASFIHEGIYICRLCTIATSGCITNLITLHVLVPPTILTYPPAAIHPASNGTIISFHFRSKPTLNTTILWYKDHERISSTSDSVMTALGELNGTTSFFVPPLAQRNFSGFYTVHIANNFIEIPSVMQVVEASFELEVTYPPTTPTSLNITMNNSLLVVLTWSMNTKVPFENADSFNICMWYLNGDLVSQTIVDGDVREVQLDVIPGVDYIVQVMAINVDGFKNAEPLQFSTPPGAPRISSIGVCQTASTMFALFGSLAYNGGANLTHLNISYRAISSQTRWSPAQLVPVWLSANGFFNASISTPFITTGGIEFSSSAINGLLFYSTPQLSEELGPPPAPNPPTVMLMGSTYAVVNVQLAGVGPIPVSEVVLLIIAVSGQQCVSKIGLFWPGNTVSFNVSDGLTENVIYKFAAYSVNCAGKSPISCADESGTKNETSGCQNDECGQVEGMTLWLKIFIPSCAIFTCVSLVALIVCIQFSCKRKKNWKDSHDSMSTCTKVFPPLAEGPLVPRSPTIQLKSYKEIFQSPAVSSDEGAYSPNTYHHFIVASSESLGTSSMDSTRPVPYSLVTTV